MAVCEIRKVYIIGDRDLRDPLIKRLGELGLFQPKKMEEDLVSSIFKQTERKEIKTDGIEENLSRLNWAIDYLGQFEKAKTGLGFFPSKVGINQGQFIDWISNFDWKAICDRCTELKNKLEVLKEERRNLLERLEFFVPWQDLPISLERLRGTRSVACQLGMVSLEAKKTLRESVSNLRGAHLYVLKEEARRIHFLLIYLREIEGSIESISHEIQMEKVQFGQFKGVPGEEMKGIRKKIGLIDRQIDKIAKESKKISKEKIKLMVLYDHFYNLLQEKRVSAHARVSSYTFALEGWIRKQDLAELKNGLRNFSLIDIIVREPDEKEEKEIPVALSNKKLFKPFELVTNLYGVPHYFEIDPTPFLAPFFALFLALCLTDGGYGIILALLAYLIPKKIQVGEGGERLFSILFIGGLVTTVIGIITGGVFGIQFSQLPSSLAPLRRLTLFNPLEQPMIFLVIALALGVIHLLIGIGLALWEDLKRGDVVSAILDHLSWIVLISGMILVLLPLGADMFLASGSSSGSLSFNIVKTWKILPAYSKIGLVMALWGIVTLFLFAGRESKSIFGRLGKGAYELYGLVSVFGDVLSYSRLLALGLATSVIATVVNLIANMASDIPLIGPVFMVIILILGHLGNIAINTLSGFIHTARLQFVEFFGKFYQGGGKSFAPFKQEGKYTIIR